MAPAKESVRFAAMVVLITSSGYKGTQISNNDEKKVNIFLV